MSNDEDDSLLGFVLPAGAARAAQAASSLTNPNAHRVISEWIRNNPCDYLDSRTYYRLMWDEMKEGRKADREAKAADRHE